MPASNQEILEVLEILMIAAYATTIPNLLLWIWVFGKILKKKDLRKFFTMIVICILMILSLIANMILFQMNYNMFEREIDGKDVTTI